MRSRRFGLVGCALAVQLALAGSAAAAAPWLPQDSGTSSNLRGVSCPVPTTCWAAGDAGTVRKSSDGGESWLGQSSGTSAALAGISCASVEHCVAVGGTTAAAIVTTENGGDTWVARSAPAGTSWLEGIDCPTAATCYAAGYGSSGGVVLVSRDAGKSWTRTPAFSTNAFYDVSCATAATCMVGGYAGEAQRTESGGVTWERVATGGVDLLSGVACPTADACFTAGYPHPATHPGRIRRTVTAGAEWSVVDTTAGAYLEAIACPTAGLCYAVGESGTIRSSLPGGTSWSSESSRTANRLSGVDCAAADSCWAVGDGGTIVSNNPLGCSGPTACGHSLPIPSDDCNVGPQTIAIDGYVGSLYTRLRTKQNGSETWVCARLQAENGQEYAGGRFVSNGGAPGAVDTSGGACAQQPGYRHLTGGVVNGQPYGLDAWTDTDDAWVCTTAAGLGARVRFSTTSFPFAPDSAASPAPPRTPWTPGVPSADCETQVTGTKTRLVNAVLGGAQVWVTAWQSGARTELCVRAERGSAKAGGRFAIEASSGVQPVLQIGSDSAGCDTTRPLFSNDSAQLEVSRSGNNANPASVCVKQGTNAIRLTAGYAGTLDPDAVSWAVDPATP